MIKKVYVLCKLEHIVGLKKGLVTVVTNLSNGGLISEDRSTRLLYLLQYHVLV